MLTGHRVYLCGTEQIQADLKAGGLLRVDTVPPRHRLLSSIQGKAHHAFQWHSRALLCLAVESTHGEQDAHINGESGVGFGASPDFARVEIAMRTSTFNLLVERLRALMAES